MQGALNFLLMIIQRIRITYQKGQKLIFMFIVTKESTSARFAYIAKDFFGRMHIHNDVLKMFLDFPLFGVGSGGFGQIFSAYSSLGTDVVFKHAESDWLHFLAETGLAGFSCVAVFTWLFFKEILYCHFLGAGKCIFLENVNLRHDRFGPVNLFSFRNGIQNCGRCGMRRNLFNHLHG